MGSKGRLVYQKPSKSTGGSIMKVTAVTSDNPKPIANYTEAFRVGDLIFAAGQLATDFKDGVPPEAKTNPAFPYYGSDIKLQTHYILKNLQSTFSAAGSSLDHVIKAQVFLTNLNDFSGFDEVWKDLFQSAARTHHRTDNRAPHQRHADRDRSGGLRSARRPRCACY